MAEKVERKTEAELGVSQALLDAHYDAVDAANQEGRDDIGRPINPRKAKVEDKAVKGPRQSAPTEPATPPVTTGSQE